MRGIEIALRILIGGLFVYAGAEKALDPIAFQLAIRSYELVGDPWPAWTALALPWLEVFAGCCVILGLLYRGGLLLLGGATAIFCMAIASAWIRGLDIDCGCFGAHGFERNYAAHIAMNLVLLGVIAFLGVRAARGSSGPSRPA